MHLKFTQSLGWTFPQTPAEHTDSLHQIKPLFTQDANKHDRVLRGWSGKGCARGVIFHVNPPEETLKARLLRVNTPVERRQSLRKVTSLAKLYWTARLCISHPPRTWTTGSDRLASPGTHQTRSVACRCPSPSCALRLSSFGLVTQHWRGDIPARQSAPGAGTTALCPR